MYLREASYFPWAVSPLQITEAKGMSQRRGLVVKDTHWHLATAFSVSSAVLFSDCFHLSL